MKKRILLSLVFGSIAANLVAAPAFAAGYYSSDSSGVPVVVEVRGGARPDQMEPDMFGKPADALAGWCAGHATLPLTFAFSRPVALDRMLVKSRGAAIRVEGDGGLLIKFQPGRDRDEDLKGVSAKTLVFRFEAAPACIESISLKARVGKKEAMLVPAVQDTGKESFSAALEGSLKAVGDCDEAAAGRLIEFPLAFRLSLHGKNKTLNPETPAAYKKACSFEGDMPSPLNQLRVTPGEGAVTRVQWGVISGDTLNGGWSYDLAWTKNGWKLRKLDFTDGYEGCDGCPGEK